ncbi:hypothetical protein AALA24_02385 [Anaerovoracaceae bacterium 42-11]
MKDKIKPKEVYILPPDKFYQSGRKRDYQAGVLYYLSVMARCIILFTTKSEPKEFEE